MFLRFKGIDNATWEEEVMKKLILSTALVFAAMAALQGEAFGDAVTVDFDHGIQTTGYDPATLEFNGNSILDSDEFALLGAILADADSPFHTAVHAAWTQNRAQMATDLGAYDAGYGIALAGYMTLGDATSVSQTVLLAAVPGKTVNPANYDLTQSAILAFDADPDEDSLDNTAEYTAIDGTGGPSSAKRAQYIVNALGGGGEGEGEGECVLEGTCPILPTIDEQGSFLYPTVFHIPYETFDFDVTGIPDSWDVALIANSLCNEGAPYHCEAVAAFNFNKDLALASAYASVADFMAAYGAISSEAAAKIAVVGIVGAHVVTIPGKAAGEPFSATGDLDGDTLTNITEYNDVVGLGLGREAYVSKASTPSDLWAGNPDLPVTGIVALGLLAAGVVAVGARMAFRKK